MMGKWTKKLVVQEPHEVSKNAIYALMVNPPNLDIWTRFCFYFKPENWLICWTWRAARISRKRRYGVFKAGQKQQYAHRLITEWMYGSGFDCADHLVCNNPECINPLHLLPSTHAQNILRLGSHSPARLNKVKTHCQAGHEFNLENTIRTKDGYRHCKTCNLARANARYARKVGNG